MVLTFFFVSVILGATDRRAPAGFEFGPPQGMDLATATDIDHTATELDDIRKRLKAREVPKKGFCWNCRKPLHARSDSCPFCGEKQ